MKIFLNNELISIENLVEEATGADVVDILELELDKKGISMMSIQIDGKIYSPDNRLELEVLQVRQIEEIRVVALSPSEIVQEAVSDAPEAFQYIQGLSDQVVSNLRIGKNKEAMEQFIGLIEGLSWLSTMLQNLGVGFAGKMVENKLEESRQRIFARFIEQMGVLSVVQKNQDWVGVADILEYEFPDIFRESRELFSNLENLLQ
ncbi:MAG: hypothetical protein HQM08_12820 [Candidatus Riflebacteria bacterium]|nr:hypothetical protein [Candidatus Riflebacteria bacterium]